MSPRQHRASGLGSVPTLCPRRLHSLRSANYIEVWAGPGKEQRTERTRPSGELPHEHGVETPFQAYVQAGHLCTRIAVEEFALAGDQRLA